MRIAVLIEDRCKPNSPAFQYLQKYAGQTVWKIAPEFAYDDLKLGLFFPLGKQIDNESFYRELSQLIPEELFLHVAHSPGVPVWTNTPLTIRGVPYLLNGGEEIDYVPQYLLNQPEN